MTLEDIQEVLRDEERRCSAQRMDVGGVFRWKR